MQQSRRSAFSLFELLVILAILGLLLALLLPAVAKVRSAAQRTRSINMMKQLGVAVHNYYDQLGALPAGNDDNSFSAAAKLLAYVEQDNLSRLLDLKKPSDDEANKKAAATVVAFFLSPNDPVANVTKETGATNYLFCAGSKFALENNDGLFYQNSNVKFAQVRDGLSNTMMTGETLKGDGGSKAAHVLRQHVLLKKSALAELTDQSGVQDFADDKNIAGNRCAAWIDGRFLQGTFSGTRAANDAKPDVSCEGTGGLSGLRSLGNVVHVGVADGSLRIVSQNMDANFWKILSSRDGSEVVPDF